MDISIFDSLSNDELWILHEHIASILAHRILEEKAQLEERLRGLEQPARAATSRDGKVSRDRIHHPYPKYKH